MILEAIVGFVEMLGSSHPETLMAGSSLAQVLVRQKRHGEVERREENVLVEKRKILSADLHSVLFSRQLLATSRAWQMREAGIDIDAKGDPQMTIALTEMREVLRLKIIGLMHPINIVNSTHNLGEMLGTSGEDI